MRYDIFNALLLLLTTSAFIVPSVDFLRPQMYE